MGSFQSAVNSVQSAVSSFPNPFKGVGLSNFASKATSGAKALASGTASALTSKPVGNFAKGALGLNRRGTTTVITGQGSTTVIRTQSGPSSVSSALGRLAGNTLLSPSSSSRKRRVTIGGNKKKPSKKETILSKKEKKSSKK